MKITRVTKEEQEKHPYHRPAFVKRTENVETKKIEAEYDSKSEWCSDPSGYFIIKVFYDEGYFGARHFSTEHVPDVDVVGKNAKEIVQTIVREGFVSSLQHAAYLGKELQKAETALLLRLNFVQDTPLDYSKKTAKKESNNLPE